MELFARLIDADNLRSAWSRVRHNHGAPGLDGLTVGGFEDRAQERLHDIAATLRRGRYKPQPLRAVDVPKDGGTGVRTLGIATIQDRIVLQALVQVLTPLWEPFFSPCSFAYRQGRIALDAVLMAQQRLQSGLHWIVDLDIKKFFDSVDQVRLMARLRERADDDRVLDLIADFLRAGLKRGDVVEPTHCGIAQGSPLSPLLANIVLDELDQEYMRLGWAFVRYADDSILLARSEPEARSELEFTRGFLADRLNLQLNETKTRIVRSDEAGFLGFTYRLSRYGKVSRKVAASALDDFRRRVVELALPAKNQPIESVFEAVGDYFRGWTLYFSLTQDDTLAIARHFACDQLRAAAWEHWRTPEERIRQLCRLGLPEAAATRAACSLHLPDEIAHLDFLRQAMPDALFDRFGLTISRAPQPRLAADSDQPLSAALSQKAAPSARAAAASPPPAAVDALRARIFRRIAVRLHIQPNPNWPI